MTKQNKPVTCSVKEAAEILKVHASTIEKLIATGDLPAGRIGRAYVMRTADVERYAEKVILDQTAARLTKGHRPASIHAGLRTA
ncbi:helix-turn-helix domain-containing protein [Comamonas fluminis]|uniref:helix-turn-helix domain-containing protein n=1 Tax=Comamonas fluminis TaxID=2796366 RepID=UPI001FE52C2A|nr:helix-turn-helix domain-containing protein [Comamonas fluminis]